MPKLRVLERDQEARLVGDERLLLVAVCALNRWTAGEITAEYRRTRAEVVKYLLVKDRMGSSNSCQAIASVRWSRATSIGCRMARSALTSWTTRWETSWVVASAKGTRRWNSPKGSSLNRRSHSYARSCADFVHAGRTARGVSGSASRAATRNRADASAQALGARKLQAAAPFGERSIAINFRPKGPLQGEVRIAST